MRTLLHSIPLIALVGCVIHTGPTANTNPAPAPAPTPAAPAAPTPAAPVATAAPPATTVTPVPVGTAAPTSTAPPSGLAVKNPPLRAPEIKKDISFGLAKPTAKTIMGEVFEIPEGTKQLPNFAGLPPLATIYTSSWDIAPRKFQDGFPGVKDRIEWFAIRWTGKVTASKAGVHVFKIKSDDGARMFIDGQLVVNNDGVHPPTDAVGQTLLNAGEHTIDLQYFQGPKYDIALQIWVTQPGTLVPKIFTTTF